MSHKDLYLFYVMVLAPNYSSYNGTDMYIYYQNKLVLFLNAAAIFIPGIYKGKFHTIIWYFL